MLCTSSSDRIFYRMILASMIVVFWFILLISTSIGLSLIPLSSCLMYSRTKRSTLVWRTLSSVPFALFQFVVIFWSLLNSSIYSIKIWVKSLTSSSIESSRSAPGAMVLSVWVGIYLSGSWFGETIYSSSCYFSLTVSFNLPLMSY